MNCGDLVTTKLGKLEGMITCKCDRFSKITYEISYFINGEQKAVWMFPEEFTLKPEEKIIGFN